MVKIALCKLFAGILCGGVVLVVLVVKWVKKPSRHIYILTALSTNRFNKEFKQVLPYQPTSGKSLGQHNPLYLFLTACCKPEQNPCKNKHGENFIAQVVVGILYGCVVLVVLVVKWVVKWVKKPSKHINILTALFTYRIHKRCKQVLPYQPTSGKPWPTSSTVRVSVSMLENRTGSMQEQTWSKLHWASCLLVFCVVAWCCWFFSLVVKWMLERNHPIISNHILAALFNNQDSEKKTPCTVPFKLSDFFLSISLTLSLSHSFSLSLSISPSLSRGEWAIIKPSKPYSNCASSQPEFTRRQASSYHGNFGHYNLLYLLATSW